MIKNFVLMLTMLVLSLAILFVTLTQLDPWGEQSAVAYVAFFISTFGASTSFFTFLFFFIVEFISGHTLGTRIFAASLRRGVLVGLFITIGFLLQIFGLFGLFEVTLLAIFLALIEFLFVTY